MKTAPVSETLSSINPNAEDIIIDDVDFDFAEMMDAYEQFAEISISESIDLDKKQTAETVFKTFSRFSDRKSPNPIADKYPIDIRIAASDALWDFATNHSILNLASDKSIIDSADRPIDVTRLIRRASTLTFYTYSDIAKNELNPAGTRLEAVDRLVKFILCTKYKEVTNQEFAKHRQEKAVTTTFRTYWAIANNIEYNNELRMKAADGLADFGSNEKIHAIIENSNIIPASIIKRALREAKNVYKQIVAAEQVPIGEEAINKLDSIN